ncbi:hypothetical protein BH10ACT10_BH10ACT10_03480 [soil metagenome]
MPASRAARVRVASRTVGVLALLGAALPVNLAVTATALVGSRFVPPVRRTADRPRTVLVSGGKMTKSLQLARAFHAAGHRVVMVESAKYRLTGHRFSRAVDRFHTVPTPGAEGYVEALLAIVEAEGVDVFVPVCSPAASYHDAVAKAALSPHCEVLHLEPAMVRTLDDKQAFSALAGSLGLSVPNHHRITDPAQVDDFDFDAATDPYVLKSIPYDPVHRLDLTPLPRPTPTETAAFARSKPISADTPWILQAFVDGQEYCTHSTVRDGRVQVYGCCESSAFQVNYATVDKPEIEAWVRGFVEPLGLTGQVSFDFIETTDGRVFPIECNPRTHSAITMFHDHPGLADAYLDPDAPPVRPLPESRPTYWIYHEVWRLLTEPRRAARLGIILRGRDAVFDWADPLPFLVLHHVHIPSLLVRSLLAGQDWLRVDFNIGKLVEAGGD